jgi:hypothetical protein
MNRVFAVLVVMCLSVAGMSLAGCQAVQPAGATMPGDAWIEQMKKEAVQHELGTFDLYINRDWKTLDAWTAPEYYGVGVDGSYTERDAMMAGLADEKLAVQPPDLGAIRVTMISPDAYMVTYSLNFNGSYDGQDFSNPRTVSSLWVRRDGQWQNIFLAEEERKGELK